MHKQLLAIAGLGVTGLLVSPVAAVAAPHVTTVSTAVQAPFNLDVSSKRVLVADGGLNAVVRVHKGGSVTTVVKSEGASGVARSADGRYLAYTSTTGGEAGITASSLRIKGPHKTVVADTRAYEFAHNPDGKKSYGVKNPSTCVSDELKRIGAPASYKGSKDSHAYSVAAYGKKFVVADAGGNDLLSVSRSGKISTLAVMPRQPLVITAKIAAKLGLKDCVVGVTYRFEAVPTDVEVGRHGWLYVTTLPGGPEDGSLPPRGKVYRVNPKTGKTKVLASRLNGATNLALGAKGEIYVAELFAGRISVIKHGVRHTFVKLPGVVSVETRADGSVWAGTLGGESTPGKIVKIKK